MRKKIAIVLIIAVLAAQISAVEIILGERTIRRSDMIADSTLDSTALVRDTAFFMTPEEVAELEGIRGQTLIGQRSRANVMRGIDQNRNTIRREYNNYIRQGNRLSGGLIVRFKVVSSGEVIYSKIVESNVDDVVFERTVASTVKRWRFPAIPIENDTTIVEYPFIFDRMN